MNRPRDEGIFNWMFSLFSSLLLAPFFKLHRDGCVCICVLIISGSSLSPSKLRRFSAHFLTSALQAKNAHPCYLSKNNNGKKNIKRDQYLQLLHLHAQPWPHIGLNSLLSSVTSTALSLFFQILLIRFIFHLILTSITFSAPAMLSLLCNAAQTSSDGSCLCSRPHTCADVA